MQPITTASLGCDSPLCFLHLGGPRVLEVPPQLVHGVERRAEEGVVSELLVLALERTRVPDLTARIVEVALDPLELRLSGLDALVGLEVPAVAEDCMGLVPSLLLELL